MKSPYASLRSPMHRRIPGRLLLVLLAIVALISGCSRKQSLSNDLVGSAIPASGAAGETGLRAVADGEARHLEGTIGPGAVWSIDKPADWNGDLVVYMHGYSDPVAAVALPAFGPIRDALLARGYAVIASSYSENGYAVKEGLEQTHQLSGLFASKIAQPRRTFLLGQSLGGLIGLLLSQKYPGQYDGTLLVCGVVGGTREEVQYLGDIRVLFDALYPGVLPGGLEHPPVITNLNAQVIGPVIAAITAHPERLPILQLLARRPLPGITTNEIVNSLVTVLAFTMQGGGDLYDRTHEHSFFDNANYTYHSSQLPPALVDPVNATVARYTATADAIEALDHWGTPSGPLGTPVIALHTTRDPVVPVFHEDLLGNVSTCPDLLQRQVVRYGHCMFTTTELMDHFDSLVGWATTGQKPAS